MVLMWLGALGGALGLGRGRSVVTPTVRMPRAAQSAGRSMGRLGSRSRVASVRRSPRPFWIRVDPRDSRHAAIGGSFAEVCAALERLAAEEAVGGR